MLRSRARTSPLRTLACALVLAGCGGPAGVGVSANTPGGKVLVPDGSGITALPGQPVVIATDYVEDRFFVTPQTEDGAALRFFADTGGGLFIKRAAVTRAGLPLATIEVDGGQAVDGALLPTMSWDAWMPPLEVFDGRLPVSDDPRLDAFGADGLLGQAWFRGRLWTFDYPERRLELRAAGDLPRGERAKRVPVGFLKNDKGERGANYPRIDLQIDGVTIDVLFDTGATVKLTRDAVAAVGDGRPALRAASFMVRSVCDGWRAKHPDWRALEAADSATGDTMVEVPAVGVAGFVVGPVWFTCRDDKSFHETLSPVMDRKVDGAVGGNVLRGFRVTLDYVGAVAVFERGSAGPEGAAPASASPAP